MLARPHVVEPTVHRTFVDGLRQIEWGYADAAIVGGAEGAIRKPTVEGFVAARALSPSLTA